MWRRLCGTILPALLLALPCPAAWGTDLSDENEVRAAIIYNLLLFVQWPPQAAPATGFHLCVLDEGALTMALRHHEGKRVLGQALTVIHSGTAPEDLGRCAAVMVEAGSGGVLPRLGALARTRALLVIAEGPNAVDRGAMIGLHTDGGRVTFDVNYGAMKRSGLVPSSKMLKLARILVE
jgi:hypothetical protein